MRRTLRLTREVLTELRTDELRTVAAGTHAGCVTHGATSCDACPTLPLNECPIQIAATITACVLDTVFCPTTPAGGQP